MKRFSVYLLLLAHLTLNAGNSLTDFVTDTAFESRRNSLGKNGNILKIAEDPALTSEEKAAMEFLYAYMSDPDMAGYSPEFYLENVRSSLRARSEMPWGRQVPEREFMHFVLPLRVNNESLDMSRPQFYEELKDRVKGLSMTDAILEVNHWCHEKVTYKPSDARTSSPLSAVSQAIGRCGEESTFAVAALRSVGIPARQVYTPRWAHTDDNHAWVEAWADGKWYFIGACEPEPVLNLAWFNAPASRGMLMNTNVFGVYTGPEEQIQQNDLTTSINVTSNYAPVKKGFVIVKDKKGNPVKNATVNFGIYNYAEFYPVARRKTDERGIASLTTGKGDVIVWASDGQNFNLGMLKGDDNEPLEIVLDKDAAYRGEIELDIVPPPARPIETYASDEQKRQNAIRFAQEDSIRNAYMSTFATPESAEETARLLRLDENRVKRVLLESRGNHKLLTRALQNMNQERREIALCLLEKISEKDRRDIPIDVLKSHVDAFVPDNEFPMDFQYEYVLNPRVENERLTTYKQMLREYVPSHKIDQFRKNPGDLAEWINANITEDSRWNPLNHRMDPVSVARMGRAAEVSKKIFFVAVARSLGIPARMDLVRGQAQYADHNLKWHDVLRKESADAGISKAAKGRLKLTFEPQAYLKDPKYYTHFTISKIVDGIPQLMEYPEEGTVSGLFGNSAEVDAGNYMLITGQRLADGGVLADVKFFDVRQNETTELPLVMREENSAVSVIGNLNSENLYHDIATDSDKSILSTTGRGYYVLGIVRNGHEPSVHTLNDISLLAKEFDERSKALGGGEKMLILFEGDDTAEFDRNSYSDLPENVTIGVDADGKILKEICDSLNLSTSDLPVFVIADTFNRIVFVSQGYTIGIGERLLRTLKKIDGE